MSKQPLWALIGNFVWAYYNQCRGRGVASVGLLGRKREIRPLDKSVADKMTNLVGDIDVDMHPPLPDDLELTDEEIQALQQKVDNLEKSAIKCGPLHSNWDVIFSARALIRDGNPWPWKTKREAYLGIMDCDES